MSARSPQGEEQEPGTLVVIGGAESVDDGRRHVILERFVQAAGGPGATLIVIPMAAALEATGERYAAIFSRRGAGTVHVLNPKTPRHANSARLIGRLEQGSGVFFTGGEQCRLAERLLGTRLERAIRAAHARGVTVGGTSAGASFLSSVMIRFGRSGSVPRTGMADLAPGLGLTSKFVIDQHFGRRNRTGRLLTALTLCPGTLGLGLGENTAAVIAGDHLEVVGHGTVVIIDPTGFTTGAGRHAGKRSHRHVPIGMSGLTFHYLVHGASFELTSRTATLPHVIARSDSP